MRPGPDISVFIAVNFLCIGPCSTHKRQAGCIVAHMMRHVFSFRPDFDSENLKEGFRKADSRWQPRVYVIGRVRYSIRFMFSELRLVFPRNVRDRWLELRGWIPLMTGFMPKVMRSSHPQLFEFVLSESQAPCTL